MRKDAFAFLVNHFSPYRPYRIELSKNGTLAEIENPLGEENIRVQYFPDDEYIVYFAFQHCHMNDEEDIIEYISDIIDGNRFSIEFFRNGARYFGGDITAEEIKDLSYESLEQYSGYYGLHKLKDLVDSFKVRGWSPKDSFDAIFTISDNGSVEIIRQD